jgi:hypothetical protein
MDSGCQTSVDEMRALFSHHQPGILHISVASTLETPLTITSELAYLLQPRFTFWTKDETKEEKVQVRYPHPGEFMHL